MLDNTFTGGVKKWTGNMKGIPFINRAAFAPNKRAFFLNGKSSGMSSMVRRRLAETTKHCASTA